MTGLDVARMQNTPYTYFFDLVLLTLFACGASSAPPLPLLLRCPASTTSSVFKPPPSAARIFSLALSAAGSSYMTSMLSSSYCAN